MPVVNIDSGWLNELLGHDYPPEQLTDAMEQIGCDVEEVVDISRYRCPACSSVLEGSMGAETVKSCGQCGFSREEPFDELDQIQVIRLDLLAALPDLLDIGGLARALKGYLGQVEGLPDFTVGASDVTVEVAAEVRDESSYRPFIRCAVVRMPPLDDRLLAAVMKLQENLHWGVGRDRKLASIGVYDLDTVTTPIRYRTLHPDDEPFEPLGMPGQPMSGRQILEEHPKGTAYAHLLADHARYPLLEDSEGKVLSMPPIINSEGTKVKAGSQNLFVDVTGISEAAVDNSLHTLVCSLMELGGKVETVRILESDGERTTPNLAPKAAEIELARANQWLGLSLDADGLVASLRRMRLDVEPLDDGRTRFRTRYPAFRSDIRHMVDVFEDVAIGFGYQKIEPALVPTMTVGGARSEELLSERVRSILLGLGYSEVMSLPVSTEEDHFTKFRLEVPAHYPRVANPKLKALTVVRTHLMGGVMSALHDNRRRPMPLKLFELDNVVLLDGTRDYGNREERRLCFAEAGRDAGYASARSTLDAMLRELGETATYTALDCATFIAGRAASFESEGLKGMLGELHPEVIVGFGLDHPIALVEVALATI
ncbi:MAG: phenylalanine--tRNA ligase subunit beta [Deltaproteobacteria bacterium]|jgi:phenylalanyl-tRNA synthetase beta chain|nr:phenylalanine--tRNA ligase subunit beta [Deltaproteobacteria bacterium]MBW2533647.1 phenylalanine--tRNA ligase subunit beta [Deltaproteobacteria bacterium]